MVGWGDEILVGDIVKVIIDLIIWAMLVMWVTIDCMLGSLLWLDIVLVDWDWITFCLTCWGKTKDQMT